MIALIVANILLFIASIIGVYNGYLKDKKRIIINHSINLILSLISYLLLGGYSGAIICFAGLLRNFLAYNERLDWPTKILLIAVAGALIVSFNNYGLVGYFPLINFAVYTSIIDTKNMLLFKRVCAFNCILSGLYNFVLFAFSAFAFNVITLIMNLIAIYQIKYKNINKMKKI